MIEILEKKLIELCGSGKTKIIYGPRHSGKHRFLFTTFKEQLINNGYEVYDSRDYTHCDFATAISKIVSEAVSNKARTAFLIDNITFLKAPYAFIDLGAGRNNIDVFLISEKNIEYQFANDATLIRGRYETIFVPYHIIDCNYNAGDSGFYYAKNDFPKIQISSKTRAVLETLISFMGTPCSLREIKARLDKSGTILTVPTINTYIYNLCEDCFIVPLSRINIRNSQIISGKKSYIPATLMMYDQFVVPELDIKKTYRVLLVACLLFDDWNLYSGIYKTQPLSGNIRTLKKESDYVVAEKNGDWYVFSISNSFEKDMLEFSLKTNTFMKKVLVTDAPIKKSYFDRGIIVCSIMSLMAEGFKPYGI